MSGRQSNLYLGNKPFRGNDSGVVGVIKGETIANGSKNLPTILRCTYSGQKGYFTFGYGAAMCYNKHHDSFH